MLRLMLPLLLRVNDDVGERLLVHVWEWRDTDPDWVEGVQEDDELPLRLPVQDALALKVGIRDGENVFVAVTDIDTECVPLLRDEHVADTLGEAEVLRGKLWVRVEDAVGDRRVGLGDWEVDDETVRVSGTESEGDEVLLMVPMRELL